MEQGRDTVYSVSRFKFADDRPPTFHKFAIDNLEHFV